MRMFLRSCALAIAAAASAANAAEQAVQIGSGYALLEQPRAARGSVILIPGGDGYLGIQPDGRFSRLGGNQLVRTRHAYASAGLAVLTLDANTDPAAAAAYMRRIAAPVTVVATSRGTLRIPQALAGQPDRVVITSGMLGSLSPGSLPPTLIVHHREDGCFATSPSTVEPFVAASGGRAQVVWLTGGVERGDPCQAGGHHGFAGLDGKVVATVAAFARR